MSKVDTSSTDAGLYESIYAGRLAEDPRRKPHEKETGFHMEGDSNRVSTTSFKKVIFADLLKHPKFVIESLTVIDSEKNESTATLLEFLENPDLTIIGVDGTLPVGNMSIGAGRASDSHAEVVKS